MRFSPSRLLLLTPLLALPAALLTAPQYIRGATLIEEHADLAFNYHEPTDTWSVQWRYGGSFEEPVLRIDPALAAIPVRDLAFQSADDPQLGDRFIQPASPAYAFTGASPGQPIWILTQADNDYAWPGMANDHEPGTVTGAIRVRLTGMTYAGEAANAHFALWDITGFSQPNPRMSTSDGIGATDFFDVSEQGHHHMNWGFTALGIYQLEFQAEAVRASDGQPITSGLHTVTFAVGTYATWLAGHFSGAALVDPNISGANADTDHDGVPVLLEYAFHLSPVKADSIGFPEGAGSSGLPRMHLRTIEGQPHLALEFPRRKAAANPQLSYQAQFGDSPTGADWDAAEILEVTSLDNTWERVVAYDPTPVSASPCRFGRVRIELLPAISY